MKNKTGKLWKKRVVLFGCMLLICTTAGCKRKEPGGKISGAPGSTGMAGATGTPAAPQKGGFRPEDALPGDTMKIKLSATERGRYFMGSSEEGGYMLTYTDWNTGKKIPLCNKPECRHDGNAFCVATNKKFNVQRIQLYGGRLLATAVEETDTQFLCKILEIALDGSAESEISTFLTLEKTGAMQVAMEEFFIHRNKIFVTAAMLGQEGFSDTEYYGLYMVDMDTKETCSVFVEGMSKENKPARNFQACGDWVYFAVQEGTKGALQNRYGLFRYHILQKTKEECKLQRPFAGNYAVPDNDTVLYFKNAEDTGELFVCRPETKLDGAILQFPVKRTLYDENGEPYEAENTGMGRGVKTDGAYVYIDVTLKTEYYKDEDGRLCPKDPYDHLLVYDKELKLVADLDKEKLFENCTCEMEGEFAAPAATALSYCGEEIYCRRLFVDGLNEYGMDNYTNRSVVFKTTRGEFLTGAPRWEVVGEESL